MIGSCNTEFLHMWLDAFSISGGVTESVYCVGPYISQVIYPAGHSIRKDERNIAVPRAIPLHPAWCHVAVSLRAARAELQI